MSLKNLSVKTKIPKLLKSKLKNKRIDQIYKKFEKSLNINENFAVAVSGGPDSLALAALSKIYAINHGLDAKFFIVDHKLRPESSKEAKLVKQILEQIFITSKILKWVGKKPSKNIQAAARVKRYELLLKECEKFGIVNILLGHHQDDLFENFFIRILRGSGLKGLISLNKKRKIGNKNLLRPLLDQKKKDLVFLSQNVFNFYIKDPSNNDEKYQRVKIRNMIETLQKNGLDKNKFFKTLKNLRYSESVIEFYVKKNLQKNTIYFEKKNKLLLNKNFFHQPYEVVFRAFSETIKLIGKKYYPPRGKKLDNIINGISNNRSFKATLGGCIIEKVNETVILFKEC